MEGLGDLGFWLAVGAVLVALIVSGAWKEREKQATIRAMMELESEGKLPPETLAYLRERDAAEEKFRREVWDWDFTRQQWAIAGTMAAFVVVILAILLAFMVFAFGEMQGLAAVGVPMAILAVGLAIAWTTWHFSRDRKNGPPPDA